MANAKTRLDESVSSNAQKSFQQGLLILAAGTLLFSIKGILIKLAYQYAVSPTVLMSIRMLIALPFYIFILGLQVRKGHAKKLNGQILLCSAVLGLFGYYIASWLDLTGLLYLPANLERLVLYSYPTIVLILTVIFLGQRMSAGLLASLLLIYSGLLIVFANDVSHLSQGQYPQQLLGASLVFASAASFAVFFVGAEVMLRKISSPLFTAIAMISASIAIVSHYLLSQPWQLILQQPLNVYYYGAAIAIFCTVIPSLFVAAGIKRVGAATGSLVGGISPILTLVLAFLFLDEAISYVQALGFAVVIIGVLNLGRLKRKA